MADATTVKLDKATYDEVMDATGKIIYTQKINGAKLNEKVSITLNTQHWNSGIYFYRVCSVTLQEEFKGKMIKM